MNQINDIKQMQDMISSLNDQLIDMYAERSEMPLSADQVKEVMHSMEQQIICFSDEKLELEKQIENLKTEVEHLKKVKKAD